ncbi:MAG: Gfo/Idh/MocA family oxidoreductase [Candidatus Nitrosopelagicus sp.]|nr:Gfo/Idh/MocA family oxidoreductase [Candidatus Nitrosopelagicus sp.]
MINVLIAGYGSIGKRHLENLSQFKDVQLTVYTKRTDLDALKQQGIIVSNSLSECLKQNQDVGFITNETSMHIPLAIKLAKEGLDLFIEKPLSDSLKNTKKLHSIIKSKNLITQMGCNLRFHPSIKKIKNMIDHNKIGKILSVQVQSCSYLPDSHRWEDYRNSFASRKDLGGGVILTNGIHEIDYLYWFFQDVKNVVSMSGHLSDLNILVEDYASSLLKFKNNVMGEVHFDYFQRPDFKSCKIRGTKGEIYWNSENNSVNVFNINKKKWETKFETGFSHNLDTYSSYIEELKHFIKCVKSRTETINNLEQGITTLKIALAIKKSSKLMKSVNI